MPLEFIPLSERFFTVACELAARIFPHDAELVKKIYAMALDPEKKYLETRRMLQYFIVIDLSSGKVIGVTGLYNHLEHPADEAWLGWFGVDPEARGKGYGRRILEWTMAEARNRGYQKFKLWTSTDPDEAVAQKLYESLGLAIYDRRPSTDYPGEEVIYRGTNL